MRTVVVVAAALVGVHLLGGSAIAYGDDAHPKDGFVPTADVAASIAEAVLIPIYGKQQVESEKPFKIFLRGQVWVVAGKDLPEDTAGGVLQVEIAKPDGRILTMNHGE